MTDLIDSLKIVLADSFAFYLKCQNYHWNVEGQNFFQYHGLFSEIYSEVYSSIDSIAEHIRTLGAFAPGSFTRFSTLSTIEDELTIPESSAMLTRLLEDNEKVLISLTKCYEECEKEKEFGLSNFIQDRIDAHKKHKWMLTASSKR